MEDGVDGHLWGHLQLVGDGSHSLGDDQSPKKLGGKLFVRSSYEGAHVVRPELKVDLISHLVVEDVTPIGISVGFHAS